ncbi:S-adenosyl-L-methionine-dependent methyltransferase [Lasiosphaeria ovina]|uniref:S-adenosyl-L-methionine-dependent methyltransferase n=1 Tax=Lasiosphaeria ovina TaxID=92902 RepID=A0AAE0NMJ8_9PEZI|nr:S-adenosyl-L-methionine-dependent methyltransferase [Lasiosphaeria ovina]
MADNYRDWDPEKYLQFEIHRKVAAIKLVKELKRLVAARWKPDCVIDLGCGPGTSTKVLESEFPNARIFGIDSSPSMIEAAKTRERAKEAPTTTYMHGNIETYVPEDGTDLIFSTEALQYLHADAQIETLQRLIQNLNPGGVLVFEHADNRAYDASAAYHEMILTIYKEAAWSQYFKQMRETERPHWAKIVAEEQYKDALNPSCSTVRTSRSVAQVILNNHQELVEWMKGAELRFILKTITDPDHRKAYLQRYMQRLEEVYPRDANGKIVLKWSMLLCVCVKKAEGIEEEGIDEEELDEVDMIVLPPDC